MRLTLPLYELRKGFWFKNIWKKKRKTVVARAKIPSSLESLGIKPIDPLEDLLEAKRKQVWIPPVDPRFMFPPRPEDHPDWNPQKAYTCDHTVKFWEGLQQIQLLTNTVVQKGLPADVNSCSEELSSSDQDHFMQRAIFQANLWDTARVKLPRRKKPDDISVWNYKTEHGIPLSRNIELLFKGITRKCSQLLALTDPSWPTKHRMIQDYNMNTQYTHENKQIYISSKSKFVLTSSEPLHRFASKDEVIDTKDTKITNMWPMTPFVDLVKSHIYKTEGSLGYVTAYNYSHHHTLFLEHSKEWTMEMRHASAILMSYAHCLQLARHHNAADALLIEPICVQTVHTDGEAFGYTCFQLNTLADSSGGSSRGYASRHNMAWIDDDLLFNKAVPRRSMLRDTKYSDYNPDVFRKILGLFGR